MTDIEQAVAVALIDEPVLGKDVVHLLAAAGLSIVPAEQAAIGAAVERMEQEFFPMRAIAATSGPNGWELSAEGYDFAGTIVYRSGRGQTLGAAISAALGDDR